MRIALVLATLCLFAITVHAADKPLYRFVDPQGVIHYTDKPPAKNAKPLVLGTPGQPGFTQSRRTSSIGLPAAPRFAVHFDTPTPGQVYLHSAAEIPVALSVMPGLIKGFGLLLKVDGANISNTPLHDIRTSLHDLGAGAHTVVAVLLNAKGQELTRSAPLKIHIRPAIAKN